jgi:hypothetical protein
LNVERWPPGMFLRDIEKSICFWLDGILYMRCTENHHAIQVTCVNLESGDISQFDDATIVREDKEVKIV